MDTMDIGNTVEVIGPSTDFPVVISISSDMVVRSIELSSLKNSSADMGLELIADNISVMALSIVAVIVVVVVVAGVVVVVVAVVVVVVAGVVVVVVVEVDVVVDVVVEVVVVVVVVEVVVGVDVVVDFFDTT